MGTSHRSSHIVVITPVFRDWDCLGQLLTDLAGEVSADISISVLVVDDAPGEPIPDSILRGDDRFASARIIRLKQNLGHQRAIAVGLWQAQWISGISHVCVIDADGEDRPSDIPEMVSASMHNADGFVVAERRQRYASVGFRIGYLGFRAVTRALTGETLNFGNFSLFPVSALPILLSKPTIWSHYAATVARSDFSLVRLPLDRASRYFGTSRMSYVGLVVHGVSAIAVFTDRVMFRLMSLSLVAFSTCLIVLVGLLGIWALTDLAIPGWATLSVGLTLVLAVQFASVLAVSLLILIGQREKFAAPIERQLGSYVDAEILLSE